MTAILHLQCKFTSGVNYRSAVVQVYKLLLNSCTYVDDCCTCYVWLLYTFTHAFCEELRNAVHSRSHNRDV